MKRYYQVTAIDTEGKTHTLVIYAMNKDTAHRFATKDFNNLYGWTIGKDYKITNIE